MNLFHKPDCLERARTCLSKGKVEEAIPLFIQAIEENRDVAFASFQLGLAYRLAGKIEDAERALLLSTTMNPANSKAWEWLSLVQSELSKEALALGSAERSLELAFDAEQKTMAKMAILQALVIQLCRLGRQNMDLEEAPETRWPKESACNETASKMLHVIEECMNSAYAPKDELWKFYTLVGIHTFKSSISRKGFEELRFLQSAYFVELIDYCVKLYKEADGTVPGCLMPDDFSMILYQWQRSRNQ